MGILKTLAWGVVGFGLYSALRPRDATRLAPAKAEPLQRWEGEGGNVPAVNPSLRAAQSSNESTPPAAASYSAHPSASN